MSLPKDWKEFLQLLNSRGAEYVVVGAFALAFHSEPRFTGDLDLLIHRTPENAKRIIEALHEFGFGSLGITCEDLLLEGNVIQLGIQPNRIDLLNFLTGGRRGSRLAESDFRRSGRSSLGLHRSGDVQGSTSCPLGVTKIWKILRRLRGKN